MFNCLAPLSGFLCFVVRLSRSSLFGSLVALSHSLAWFVLFSFFCARTIYIYYLFFIYIISSSIWELNLVESFSWFRGENLFHTQGGFSVLTLLAFGDEKYYICIEIWEEPRLLPFCFTSPLKTGVLGAHPGKICLPLIFLSLPLSKTKRRVGKIWRWKVFPKVKNVNAESPKKTLKIVVFFGALFPLFSPSMLMNGFIKAAFIFWGHELIVWTRLEQGLNKDCTRIVHELFTNCSKLMRQLMGINGETFLAGSAPKKN